MKILKVLNRVKFGIIRRINEFEATFVKRLYANILTSKNSVFELISKF